MALTELATTFGSFLGEIAAISGVLGAFVLFFGVMFFGEIAVLILLFLSQEGILSLWTAVIFSVLGTLAADLFWFTMSRNFFRTGVQSPLGRYIVRPMYEFLDFFSKNRVFISLVLCKYLVGLRLAFMIYMGRQPISFKRFFLYETFAVIIYMAFLTGLYVFLGSVMRDVFKVYHTVANLILISLLLLGISHLIKVYARKESEKEGI